jgi:hypothetical protein
VIADSLLPALTDAVQDLTVDRPTQT